MSGQLAFWPAPDAGPGAIAAYLAAIAIEDRDDLAHRDREHVEAQLAEQRNDVRARCEHAAGCRCPRPLPGPADEDGDRTCVLCGRRVTA
jgi:hypothetical protein